MKKYKVNEIFYSIQGEGFHAGRAAIFIRFAGCNLSCDFCDTDFESFKEMTRKEIIKEVDNYPTKFLVLTGGEPMLQVDICLLEELKEKGFYIAIETNGTIPIRIKKRILFDWITVSPKPPNIVCQIQGDELKLVYNGEQLIFLDFYIKMNFKHFYLQPMDGDDIIENRKLTARAVMEHPKWKVSIQMHKILGVE